VGKPEDVQLTFSTQSTAILPVAGKTDAFIYVGDRWYPRNLSTSRSIWLPFEFDGEKPVLKWQEQWDLSVFK
jgi:hypothetical protein